MAKDSETQARNIVGPARFSSLCLFSWLIIQTGALALAALRIPLWARAPAAGEFLAVEILLSVQILAAAVLCPKLTDGWRATLVAIVTTWPFAVLAGLLAARSVPTIVCSGAYVSSWLVVLGIWRSCCSTARLQMTASAIAAAWVTAGPVLLFIRGEYSFSPPPPPTQGLTHLFGPLVSALTLANSTDSAWKLGPWLALAICAVIGGAIWGLKRAIKGRPTSIVQMPG